jgi:hypothetical protein
LSDEQKRRNYDMHGSEEGFSMGGQDINPEEIFKMFFGRGGDPFQNLFGGGGGGGFTVYSNMGGDPGTPTRRPSSNQNRQQQQNPFGNGPNIFDILNGMNDPRRRRPAQQNDVRQQQYAQEQDHEPLNAYFQKRQQRGQNNRETRNDVMTPEKLLMS